MKILPLKSDDLGRSGGVHRCENLSNCILHIAYCMDIGYWILVLSNIGQDVWTLYWGSVEFTLPLSLPLANRKNAFMWSILCLGLFSFCLKIFGRPCSDDRVRRCLQGRRLLTAGESSENSFRLKNLFSVFGFRKTAFKKGGICELLLKRPLFQ